MTAAALEFILSSVTHEVVAPVVVVRLENGSETYVNRGGSIPRTATRASVAHLLSIGAIRPVGGAR